MDIQPKRGMAVVWANLNDKDMKKREDGTWHEALPVIRGVKYGANAWYRLRRFTDDCDEDVFDEWEEKHNIDDDDDDDDDDDNDDDDDDDDVDDNNDNKDEGDSNENVATITA
jgi:hypothetical protein